jgi:nitroreductase
MELFEAMRTTFAARDYTGEDISDEVLYNVLENARFAPSGGNRQGARVIVVRDAKSKDALARLAEPAAKRYIAQVQAGESPWNSIIPTSVSVETIEQTPPPQILTKPFRDSSVVLVMLVDLRVVASMDQDLKRVGVISGGSIYPMVWNILMGLRQAGFGGTITTLTSALESEVQTLFGIPEHFAVCACVPVGKPVKQLTKLKRLPVSDFVTSERFDGQRFEAP